jgi:hypothetical protein
LVTQTPTHLRSHSPSPSPVICRVIVSCSRFATDRDLAGGHQLLMSCCVAGAVGRCDDRRRARHARAAWRVGSCDPVARHGGGVVVVVVPASLSRALAPPLPLTLSLSLSHLYALPNTTLSLSFCPDESSCVFAGLSCLNSPFVQLCHLQGRRTAAAYRHQAHGRKGMPIGHWSHIRTHTRTNAHAPTHGTGCSELCAGRRTPAHAHSRARCACGVFARCCGRGDPACWSTHARRGGVCAGAPGACGAVVM